jgi:hypothetical protein
MGEDDRATGRAGDGAAAGCSWCSATARAGGDALQQLRCPSLRKRESIGDPDGEGGVLGDPCDAGPELDYRRSSPVP